MSGETLTRNGAGQSRWRTLRYTPMRDVLRGRFSGRLDTKQIIADADLPASLADLVCETTRRTRLSRLEKPEVARELAAHFRDGLDAGAAQGELLGSFGEPRAAARLIRRAKLRCRSAPWKLMSFAIRGTLALFAIALLFVIVLAARLHVGKPTLSHNYLAEMNAPFRAIPERDRAWPLYRKAYLATSKWPNVDRDEFHPHSEHWPELVAFAQANSEALNLYREAAARPRLGRPVDTVGDPELDARHSELPGGSNPNGDSAEENPSLINITLPQLSVLHEAARLLAIDAHVAAIAGAGERANSDIHALLGMAEHAAEVPTLISDMVALSILAKDSELIREILADHPDALTDQQLVDLSHQLSAARGGGALRVRIGSERVFFEDVVQRIYTDDGAGDGHILADGLHLLHWSYTGQYSSLKNVPAAMGMSITNRREMMRRYDELMTAAEAEAIVPLWKRTGLSAVEREFKRLRSRPLGSMRYVLISVLVPSLSRCSVIAELTTQRRDATLAAIACELYRRETGDWPAALADLKPRYLPAVPLDRFDGQPLRYRLIDGSPRIYSVGADGDDDGGRIPDAKNARGSVADWHAPAIRDSLIADGSPEIPDADWVLWPPVSD